MSEQVPQNTITYEQTDQGEQSLMPMVKPISLRQRLQALTSGPLRARRQQKPLTIGLFNEDARNQLALFKP